LLLIFCRFDKYSSAKPNPQYYSGYGLYRCDLLSRSDVHAHHSLIRSRRERRFRRDQSYFGIGSYCFNNRFVIYREVPERLVYFNYNWLMGQKASAFKPSSQGWGQDERSITWGNGQGHQD